MKKIKQIIMSMVFVVTFLNCNISIFASEVQENTIVLNQENKGYTDENGEYKSPIIYGEIKEGTFLRSFEEELLTIPDIEIIGNEIRTQEKEKLMNAWKISEDSFTEQMKKDGYVWYSEDDVIQKESDLVGECGEDNTFIKRNDITTDVKYDSEGNPVVSIGKGYVTFTSIVQSDIHEVCYIQIVSSNSFKAYEFEIFEYNNYTTSVQLPAGNYYVSGGGIAKDYTSNYPISNVGFEVTEGAATIVTVTIGNINKDALEDGIIIEKQTEAETESKINEVSEEIKISSIIFLVIRIVTLLSLLIGGIVFFVKKNGIRGQ